MKAVFATLQHSSANLVPPSPFTSLFPFDSSSYFQAWIPAAAFQCPFEQSCGCTDLQDWSQARRNPLLLGTDRRWKAPRCCCKHGPHLSIAEQGVGRAHHLLAHRWKPVFVLFHGFILGALQQTEENLISITTGHEQTSGLNQLVSHGTQASHFQPRSRRAFWTPGNSRSITAPQSRPVQWDPQGRWRCLWRPTKRRRGRALLRAARGRSAWPSAECRCRARGPRLSLAGSTDWCQLPAAPGRAPRGGRGQGRPRTEPAGAKQQVAPAEVIRITFNGRAGSIFSPVYAEGPGAALLMLQGTRGTHWLH